MRATADSRMDVKSLLPGSFFQASPLDQFDLLVVWDLVYPEGDYSITNFTIMNLFIIGSLFSIFYLDKRERKDTLVMRDLYTRGWYKLIDSMLEVVTGVILEIISGSARKTYFPFLSSVFMFILLSNIAGLIPYSFASMSHLCVTLFLSLTVFLGLNVLLIKKHGRESLSLFIPANSGVILATLLVPIEFVSYLVRPFSLGVRLFVNLMAGHTLMKVVIGFSWSLILLKSYLSALFIIPALIISVLFALELLVAFIQAYVFLVLSCVYIQDIKY